MPIGADSTASGLQLLSAMRRDPVGMKYANLLEPATPSAPPQDAYMRVLEVAKVLSAMTHPSSTCCRIWTIDQSGSLL